MEHNPNFLKKFNLQGSPEAQSAARRTKIRTGEAVEQKAGPLVQNYLDRFSEILNRKGSYKNGLNKREHGIEAVKRFLHKENLIEPAVATDQHLDQQKKIAREQGHGDVNIPNSLRETIKVAVKRVASGESVEEALHNLSDEQKQMVEEIIALVENQKQSLDQWVDYMASPDATYPDWLKYWSIRNVLGLSKYDKDKKVFPKREKNTTNPFPDLNREALAYVLDAINKKQEGQTINFEQLEEQDRAEFDKLLKTENFAKLYAWAMEKVTPASVELLSITDGKWVKHKKGSNHLPLVQSLQGHGTGWCTAGEAVAQSQLARGDFYVYYTLNEQNQPTIPRAAIRMEGDKIAEVRGIAAQQNLDPHIGGEVAKKMAEFPDGKEYQAKAEDMKRLTDIEKKMVKNQALTKEDLVLLYEIDHKIQGFGYGDDPRIREIRDKRDTKADAPIVFECEPNQIAYSQNQITENTKAYIGPLFTNIFKQLAHLDHIYTKFPEGKIYQESIKIDKNKTPAQYLAEFKKLGIQISNYVKYMLEHMSGSSDEEKKKNILDRIKEGIFGNEDNSTTEQVDMIRLTVADLGFPNGATKEQIYKRKEELGLDLCPAEVGPNYRLQYADQPIGEYVYVGMEPILGTGGDPRVFSVGRGGGGSWLGSGWARPGSQFSSGLLFLFRSRK